MHCLVYARMHINLVGRFSKLVQRDLTNRDTERVGEFRHVLKSIKSTVIVGSNNDTIRSFQCTQVKKRLEIQLKFILISRTP